MKQNVTECGFMDEFEAHGRGNQFSYAALSALYAWLEELGDDTGEEYTLDVIALCCEFSEHQSALECLADCGYGFEPDADDDEDGREESALDWLRENTTVIEFDGGIIIQVF